MGVTQYKKLERYPDGKIPAPRRYIDYSGQLVIRTRYGTIQRWKGDGCETVEGGVAPYILGAHWCGDESDVLAAKNEELEVGQFSVYYVEDGETEYYEVDS
jgi:hypothetical protein